MLIWLLVIAGAIILDQGSKLLVWYAMGLDEAGESIPIIEDFLHFTHVKNTGAAFGMFGEENQRWIFMVLSVLGIGALLVYLWKFRPESKFACISLSLTIGGGIGNMIDRIFRVGTVRGEERNFVFDFIDFRGFGDLWKWTFNVADMFVCVGAGMLIVWCVYSLIVEIKTERQKKATAGADAVAIENSDSNDNSSLESEAEKELENQINDSEESGEQNLSEETEEKE